VVDFFVLDDEAEYAKLKGHFPIAIVPIGIFLNLFYFLNNLFVAAFNLPITGLPAGEAGLLSSSFARLWTVVLLMLADPN